MQAGTGNLILPIANTYKGITKATAGTLTVDNALAVQNSIVQTGAGGTIVFDPSLAGQSVTVGGLSSIVSGTDTGVAYAGPDMNLLINSVATNSAAPTTYSGVIAARRRSPSRGAIRRRSAAPTPTARPRTSTSARLGSPISARFGQRRCHGQRHQ